MTFHFVEKSPHFSCFQKAWGSIFIHFRRTTRLWFNFNLIYSNFSIYKSSELWILPSNSCVSCNLFGFVWIQRHFGNSDTLWNVVTAVKWRIVLLTWIIILFKLWTNEVKSVGDIVLSTWIIVVLKRWTNEVKCVGSHQNHIINNLTVHKQLKMQPGFVHYRLTSLTRGRVGVVMETGGG